MSDRQCPECGSYTVHPHCNDKECKGLICYKAGCRYDSGDCVKTDGLTSTPPYERLDRSPGVKMTRYKRILRIGTFTNTLWSEEPVANGWLMDPQDPAPAWPMDELRAMWLHFSAIAVLPTGGSQ